MTGMLQHSDTIEYGEAERSLLVQGEPLLEKEQIKLPILSFLKVMLGWKIRSLSFEKGVSNRELLNFIQIIGQNPDDGEGDKNIRQQMKDHKITHIQIDEKIYVEKDSGQSIVAGMDISDEDIAKHILGDQPLSKEMLESLRSFATDPEWISRVFETGIKQLVEEEQDHSSHDVSEIFARMMNAFETASEADISEISKYLINSISEMDDDGLMTVLTQNLDEVFGENFLDILVKELDNSKFQMFIHRIKQMVNTVDSKEECSQFQIVTNRQHASLMKNIKKVQFLSESDPSHSEFGDKTAFDEYTLRTGQLGAALNGILKCQAIISHERIMLDRMEETVENLLANEKYSTIVTLFGQMGHLLLNKDHEVRSAAAKLLSKIDEKFVVIGCLDERVLLSQKLTEWIKHETEFSSEYEKILGQLEKLTRTLMEKHRFLDAEKILQAVNLVCCSGQSRVKEIRNAVLKLLQSLATEDILTKIFENPGSDDAKNINDNIGCLVILGSVKIERLLDMLHDSQHLSERNRIIRVISEIGAPCAKPVAQRLQQNAPWFYVRNLTLLLGRIGSASDLDLLGHFLKDKNPRIQREAVLAIQNIGGATAGIVLYKNLHTVDDEVKSTVVSVLGMLECKEAVPDLIELLESKTPGRSKKMKINFMIKICEALGRIGEEMAVPVLKRIIRTKGFLTKVYDPTVRTAAEEALNRI
ncbi:MAG: hypothetical protein DRH32_04040 [Deltaproteobacteria bacterium]|nr:MAG: hypothetical protein DRH32_04040 [Deltaproteobacteria bacterium]